MSRSGFRLELGNKLVNSRDEFEERMSEAKAGVTQGLASQTTSRPRPGLLEVKSRPIAILFISLTSE